MKLKNYNQRVVEIPIEIRNSVKEYFDMKEEKLKELQKMAKNMNVMMMIPIDAHVTRAELFNEKVARIKEVSKRVNKAIGLCEDCGKQDCQCGFGE